MYRASCETGNSVSTKWGISFRNGLFSAVLFVENIYGFRVFFSCIYIDGKGEIKKITSDYQALAI